MISVAFIYIILINLVAFVVFGVDKMKARKGLWRVPENTLFLLAILGGSIGALLGMFVFRHKIKHRKFTFGIPLILATQVALLLTIGCKGSYNNQKESQNDKTPEIQTVDRLQLPERRHFEPEHSPTTLIIMYDTIIGKQPLLDAIDDYGASIIYDYHIIPGMAIRKPDNRTLEESREYFKQVKGVKTVEYDHIIRLTDPVKPRVFER